MADVSVGVDSGGTFTDAVALGDDGVLRTAKVPSTPDDPAAATALGCAAASGTDVAGELRHGTTVPTNALLERAGARTALVTTEGFADVIEIGRQRRPDLYDIDAERPVPLVPAPLRFEVRERVDHHGEVLVPLDDAAVAGLCERVDAAEPEAVAICLLHSYADDEHERLLAARLARPGRTVVASAVGVPELREYERTSTTVLHAYLGPGTAAYLDRLVARPDCPRRVLVMRSAGGLAEVSTIVGRPADALLSGPAAGALAAAAVAERAGYPDAIAFDMGGTSTDVCLIEAGRPAVRALTEVGGLPCLSPALAVHTVGAGGGSIAAFDAGGALTVGPRSAGALPGPACYGRGGVLPTVTDANVVLGRVADLVGGDFPVAAGLARKALAPLGEGGAGAVVAVVDAVMERALREVSVHRGVDPAGCALIAFGGAGGLHAAALAQALGCPAVVVPPQAGVLSAVGLLAAPVRADRSLTRIGALADLDPVVLRPLQEAVQAELAGFTGVTCELAVECRYVGQSHELRVPVVAGDTVAALEERFHVAHERHNGYRRESASVEVVTLRASAEAPAGVGVADLLGHDPEQPRGVPTSRPGPEGLLRWDRSALPTGFTTAGPCVVDDFDSTTWVPDGFRLAVDTHRNLVLEQP